MHFNDRRQVCRNYMTLTYDIPRAALIVPYRKLIAHASFVTRNKGRLPLTCLCAILAVRWYHVMGRNSGTDDVHHKLVTTLLCV